VREWVFAQAAIGAFERVNHSAKREN